MLAYPILYSFRRCPYAIRARLALSACGLTVIIREVDLKHKPPCLLQANPNGTVPTLLLNQQSILNQSLDIVEHCRQSPHGHHIALSTQQQYVFSALLEPLSTIIHHINQIKYQPDLPPPEEKRALDTIHLYLSQLNQSLNQQMYLASDHFSIADLTIVPFIRQLNGVDHSYVSQHPQVDNWLEKIVTSSLFTHIMQKYPIWTPDQTPVLLTGLSR